MTIVFQKVFILLYKMPVVVVLQGLAWSGCSCLYIHRHLVNSGMSDAVPISRGSERIGESSFLQKFTENNKQMQSMALC